MSVHDMTLRSNTRLPWYCKKTVTDLNTTVQFDILKFYYDINIKLLLSFRTDPYAKNTTL